MPHFQKRYDFSYYICELHLLKILHDIGIYNSVIAGIKEVGEDDYYELVELAMEHVAPIYSCDDVPIGWDEEAISEEEADDEVYYDHYHRVYRFSDPAIQEYYALCRVYEFRRALSPQENSYVKTAEDYCANCFNEVNGQFGFLLNDEKFWVGFAIESCPDYGYDEIEIILAIHKSLEYYRENLPKLRLQILTGPPVFLPMLPAPKGVAFA